MFLEEPLALSLLVKPVFFHTSAGPNMEIFAPQLFFVNTKGMIFGIGTQLPLAKHVFFTASITPQQILLKSVMSCLLKVSFCDFASQIYFNLSKRS